MKKIAFVFVGLVIMLSAASSFAADAPQITYTIACNGCANSYFQGQEVEMQVLISTDTDLQGWTFGIKWDPAELSLISTDVGSALQTIIDTSDEFYDHKASLADGTPGPANGPGITQAVVVSLMQTKVLPAGDNYEVERMTFKILADPQVGEGPLSLPVTFSPDLGDPPVDIVAVVNGDSLTPVMENGEIVVDAGGNCQIQNFTCESDPDNVYLSWDFIGCNSENPFDVLLLYRDGELISEVGSLGPDDTTFDDLGLDAGVYTYTLAWVYWPISGDPVTLDYVQCEAEVIALVVDDASPKSAFLSGKVRDGLGNLIHGEIVLTGRGFTSVEDTEILIGDLPVTVTEVTDDTEIRGTIPCSSVPGVYDITLKNSRGEYTLPSAFTYGWLRGDVDLNGDIDLQDCIDILNFLFKLEGWHPLLCVDAADVNDNGTLDISDPIFLSYSLFSGDIDHYKIAEPYDSPLVDDPTADKLDCSLDGYNCEDSMP